MVGFSLFAWGFLIFGNFFFVSLVWGFLLVLRFFAWFFVVVCLGVLFCLLFGWEKFSKMIHVSLVWLLLVYQY